jgi:hypothetical protein
MELRATIIERSVLWGLVAGIVFLSATLLLYVRWARHPLSIVVTSLLALSIAYLWPDAGLIIGQLAVVAGLFVVLMLLVRSLILRQPQRSALTPRMRADESRRAVIRPTPPREPKSTRAAELSIKSGEARVG